LNLNKTLYNASNSNSNINNSNLNNNNRGGTRTWHAPNATKRPWPGPGNGLQVTQQAGAKLQIFQNIKALEKFMSTQVDSI